MSRPLPLLRLAAAASFCVLSSPALAADTSSDAVFTNTILSTAPDGSTESLWLDRDGVYRADGQHRGKSDGHWRLTDGKLCLKQSHPFPVPFSFCSKAQSNVVVGSTWTSRSYTGQTVQVTLISGRPGSNQRAANDAASPRP
jgi:hypothetical protein